MIFVCVCANADPLTAAWRVDDFSDLFVNGLKAGSQSGGSVTQQVDGLGVQPLQTVEIRATNTGGPGMIIGQMVVRGEAIVTGLEEFFFSNFMQLLRLGLRHIAQAYNG